jgi:hypothetical protein
VRISLLLKGTPRAVPDTIATISDVLQKHCNAMDHNSW